MLHFMHEYQTHDQNVCIHVAIQPCCHPGLLEAANVSENPLPATYHMRTLLVGYAGTAQSI